VKPSTITALPVELAYRLAARAETQRWLVTGLWSEEAVGLVGGNQKERIMRRSRFSALIFMNTTPR